MRIKKRTKGFTLAELLIVVAIIAVLVAVSIPIFTAQTEKAKAATDMANVRAAKAAAVTDYLTNVYSSTVTYYYDADSGKVITDSTAAAALKGYGKSTKEVSNATGIPYDNGTAHIVSVTIAANGYRSATWTMGTGGSSDNTGDSVNKELSSLGTSTWASYAENGQYGVTIPAGTLVTDGSDLFLFFAESDYYSGDMRDVSLSSSYDSGVFAGRVLKITSSTPIYTEKNFLSTFDGKTVPAGTIANYNGTYLSLGAAYDVNQYRLPAAGDNHWVLIK